MPRRCMSSRPGGRFQNTKKARVEYAEPEQKAEPPPSSTSPFGFGSQQQQQGQQQQMYGSAPASSAMPTYTRDRERDQQGSQWEALGMGTVAHMQKVYGTLALGIGIAAGASMFTMATPLSLPLSDTLLLLCACALFPQVHDAQGRARHRPASPPHHHRPLRHDDGIVPDGQAGLDAEAWRAVGGRGHHADGLRDWRHVCAGHERVVRLLQRLRATTSISFSDDTHFYSFCPSFRYPLLHNIYLYGGLSIFTLYIAYDTQKMIDEYEMGEDDHIKHATDLFLDFKIVFTRVMQLLYMSNDD